MAYADKTRTLTIVPTGSEYLPSDYPPTGHISSQSILIPPGRMLTVLNVSSYASPNTTLVGVDTTTEFVEIFTTDLTNNSESTVIRVNMGSPTNPQELDYTGAQYGNSLPINIVNNESDFLVLSFRVVTGGGGYDNSAMIVTEVRVTDPGRLA